MTETTDLETSGAVSYTHLTSFYTDRRIVSAISDALATSGVTLKRCLDPSSGMGAFAETFAKQVGIVDALEKDLLTARISQALHPYGEGNIFVRNEPFEAIAPLEEAEKYDLVTSNIPFGDFMVYDREYSRDVYKRQPTFLPSAKSCSHSHLHLDRKATLHITALSVVVRVWGSMPRWRDARTTIVISTYSVKYAVDVYKRQPLRPARSCHCYLLP